MSDTSGTPSAPAQPAAPAAAPTAPVAPAQTASAPEEHYVPQKDVDRIVGERLGRAKEQFEREHADKIEQAKKDAVAETTKGFNTRLVTTSAKALAREMGFHDPNDAVAVIDSEKLPIKDGDVDEDELKKALTKLATDKPYLVKSDKTPPRAPASKPKMPEGQAPEGEQPRMKAADALRQLAASKRH